MIRGNNDTVITHAWRSSMAKICLSFVAKTLYAFIQVFWPTTIIHTFGLADLGKQQEVISTKSSRFALLIIFSHLIAQAQNWTFGTQANNWMQQAWNVFCSNAELNTNSGLVCVDWVDNAEAPETYRIEGKWHAVYQSYCCWAPARLGHHRPISVHVCFSVAQPRLVDATCHLC